jgi:hypothetical protein
VRAVACRAGIGAVTLLAAVVGDGGRAVADAPAAQAWWSAAPQAVPATAADVPADGLLVRGGPAAESPSAFAALSFGLAAGATPSTLTLQVVPTAANVPSSSVRACRLSGSFMPVQGGDMATAPTFDCTGAAAVAVDGDHVTMDVSGLAASGELNVAIVPANATDRLAFHKPGADALAVRDVTGGVAPGAAADSADLFDTATAAPAPTFDVAPLPAPTFDVVPLPAPTPAQATASRPPSATERAAAAAAVALGATPYGGARPLAVALLLGAAGAAVLLWLGAGVRAARLPVALRPAGLGGRQVVDAPGAAPDEVAAVDRDHLAGDVAGVVR